MQMMIQMMIVVIMGLSYLPHAEVEHCADVDDQEESAHNGESKHWWGNIFCKKESKRKRDENEEKVIKEKGWEKRKTWSPCWTILFTGRRENLLAGSRPVHRVHFEVRHCNREVDVNDVNSGGCRWSCLRGLRRWSRSLYEVDNPETNFFSWPHHWFRHYSVE